MKPSSGVLTPEDLRLHPRWPDHLPDPDVLRRVGEGDGGLRRRPDRLGEDRFDCEGVGQPRHRAGQLERRGRPEPDDDGERPLAGTIERTLTVNATDRSGQPVSFTRKIVVSFDGAQFASATITRRDGSTETFQIDPANRRAKRP